MHIGVIVQMIWGSLLSSNEEDDDDNDVDDCPVDC